MTRRPHPVAARQLVDDLARTSWHDKAVWHVRAKRDAAVSEVADWQALRHHAQAVRRYGLEHLDELIAQFAKNASSHGVVIHWAPTAADLRDTVGGLLKERGVERVVKSKSMLTEECGLNPHLAALGIDVVDTDLGERIVQLRQEPPSHIVMPAIHLKRSEVGATFHTHLGTPAGETDPTRLTRAARRDLRQRFLGAQAGITGVNFAVAEDGALVVCTNEGNADLGAHLPPLHIACMGIDKVIPRRADLPVFLRMLARSATGQPITAYTSIFRGPREGAELHLVIVDNGRSRLLGDPELRAALTCIRCGACLNTCPVYRRSGGHSYGDGVLPGPIGAVLGAARAPETHGDLAHASTLCGSCREVCPVGVPLPAQLQVLRARAASARPWWERAGLRLMAHVLADPVRAERWGDWLSWAHRLLPKRAARRMPPPARHSFRQLARARRQRSTTAGPTTAGPKK